jgi:putative two-component system response regulator
MSDMVVKILIVDDSRTDRLIINNMLTEFLVLQAENGLEAMRIIDENLDIDLIILDLNMPIMNGFQVLETLRGDPKYEKMRVIILTNFDEIENEIRGLEMGAVDYIRKPVNMKSLRIRIDIHLKLKSIQKKIEQDNVLLDAMVAAKTKELVITRDITIHALVGLLEVRNFESFNHTMRTQLMMNRLCRHLQTKDQFRDIMTDYYVSMLTTTAPLHDIGKVGIPDQILLKPGKLTVEEFTIMKKHVDFGVIALQSELVPNEIVPDFIKTAIEIVQNHHERFDGLGYPRGIKGKDIPLPGRLMAIIDVFDALISRRVYKLAFGYEESLEIIKTANGTQFDPEIVQAFLEISEEIRQISKQYLQ